jgi:hypothetical protein
MDQEIEKDKTKERAVEMLFIPRYTGQEIGKVVEDIFRELTRIVQAENIGCERPRKPFGRCQ